MSKPHTKTAQPSGKAQTYFAEHLHVAVAQPPSLVGSWCGPAATDVLALEVSGGVRARGCGEFHGGGGQRKPNRVHARVSDQWPLTTGPKNHHEIERVRACE